MGPIGQTVTLSETLARVWLDGSSAIFTASAKDTLISDQGH